MSFEYSELSGRPVIHVPVKIDTDTWLRKAYTRCKQSTEQGEQNAASYPDDIQIKENFHCNPPLRNHYGRIVSHNPQFFYKYLGYFQKISAC